MEIEWFSRVIKKRLTIGGFYSVGVDVPFKCFLLGVVIRN